MRFNRFVCIVVFAFSYFNLSGALLIQGDVKSEGSDIASTSFSFPVAVQAFNSLTGNFFIGGKKLDTVSTGKYAISLAERDKQIFSPLALERVSLNGKLGTNPIYGASISEMSLLDGKPLVTLESDLNHLYVTALEEVSVLVDKDTKDQVMVIAVYSSDTVNDATGNKSSGIIGISGMGTTSYCVAAVFPKDNASKYFGQIGSGIALGLLHSSNVVLNEGEDPQNILVLDMLDANTGKLGGNKAVPLDNTSSLIRIGQGDIQIKNTKLCIHYASDGDRAYFPLTIHTKEDAGARAVVIGRVNGNALNLNPIAPVSAIGPDSIIGTSEANQTVSIRRIASLKTSTDLPYIIGVGGVGDIAMTGQQVFALPIVNYHESDFSLIGTIAKRNQIPHDVYIGNNRIFETRQFRVPATNPEDIPSSNSPEAMVGGGPAPERVEDIFVYRDAVYILTNRDGDGERKGIFHSQALFDDLGRISGWTRWVRAAGTDKQMSGFAFDGKNGRFWYVANQNGLANTVYRTFWDGTSTDQNGLTPPGQDSALSKFTDELFKDVPAGIQGLVSFGPETQGLNQTAGKRLGFMSITGNRTVVLLETGADTSSGFFGPITYFGEPFVSEDGSLRGLPEKNKVIKVSGGDLNNIGPIVTSTIVTNGEYGWLVVGGSGGVAILATPDGRGWPVDEGFGLSKGFRGLLEEMRFIKLGDLCNVHNLQGDNDRLFITGLDRFMRTVINIDVIRSADPEITVLGDSRTFDMRGATYFLDSYVARDYALLATNKGLFEIGTRRDVRDVETERDAAWRLVEMPYNPGQASRIFPIVPAAYDGELKIKGLNFYVLGTSASNNQARIYRYTLEGGSQTRKLKLFPDIFERSAGSTYLVSLGVYQSYIFTNGAGIYLTGSDFFRRAADVQLLSVGVRSGNNLIASSVVIPLTLPTAIGIGSVSTDPGSGAVFVWSNEGLRLNS